MPRELPEKLEGALRILTLRRSRSEWQRSELAGRRHREARPAGARGAQPGHHRLRQPQSLLELSGERRGHRRPVRRPGRGGHAEGLQELEEALLVLSGFDEGPDLVLHYKYMMVLEGNPEYEHHFNPSDELSPTQRAFARTQWQLFKDWWDRWSGKEA